jgi:hypothetical protein
MRPAVVALILMAVPLGLLALDPQRREHADEVRVPGTDITLKSDWQMLLYQDCRFAVPLSWQPDPDGAFSRAPDGTTIGLQVLTVANWPRHKADIREAYGRAAVVREDTDRRLWLELRKPPRIEHYMAVITGTTACVAMIELHDTSLLDRDGTLARIAGSIGLASEIGQR